ncbi:MAG: hypothetical protein ACXWZS_11230 [Gemmatirosa sp.]
MLPTAHFFRPLRAVATVITIAAAHLGAFVDAGHAASAEPMQGIYLGIRFNIDGRPYQDYWTFFPDGRVMDADPYEGLARPVDLDFICRRHACGTYTRTGSTLRIRWADADERVYDVEADGAFHERRKTQRYRPLAPLDGMRLDARFAVLDTERDTALVSIRFSADGRFAEERLMRWTAWAQLGAPGETRAALAGGAGRYTIGRNTLALAYDGGRTAYFTIVVPPGEAGKPVPDAVYVNTARLERVR